MPSFIIHDASETIRGVYSFVHCDPASVKSRNTPEGMTALDVDPAHEVVRDQRNWIVRDGKLTQKTNMKRAAQPELKTLAFHELELLD